MASVVAAPSVDNLQQIRQTRQENKEKEIKKILDAGLNFEASFDDIENARKGQEGDSVYDWIYQQSGEATGLLTDSTDATVELAACVQFIDKYVLVQKAAKTKNVTVGKISVSSGTSSLETGKWTPRRVDTYCRLRLIRTVVAITGGKNGPDEKKKFTDFLKLMAKSMIMPLSATYGLPTMVQIIDHSEPIKMFFLSMAVCAAPGLMIKYDNMKSSVIAVLSYQASYAKEIGLTKTANGNDYMTKEDIFQGIMKESSKLTESDFNRAEAVAKLLATYKPKQKTSTVLMNAHMTSINKVMNAFKKPAVVVPSGSQASPSGSAPW